MKALINFEIRKKIRNSKTWGALFICIILSFCYLWYCMFQQPIKRRDIINDTYNQCAKITEQIKELSNKANTYSRDSQEYQNIINQQKELSNLDKLYRHRGAYLSNIENYAEQYYLNEIEILKAIDADQEGILKLQYLLDNEIPFQIEEYSTNTIFFLRNYFENIFPWITVVLTLLLAVESISDEFENETFKFTLTQPNDRKTLLLSKILVNGVVSLFVSLIVIIIIAVYTYIQYGLGPLDYPLVYESASETFNSIVSYFPYLFIVGLIQLAFCNIVNHFIVTKMKEMIASFLPSAAAYIAAYLISDKIFVLRFIIPNIRLNVSDLVGINPLMIVYYCVFYLLMTWLFMRYQLREFERMDIL